MADTEFAPGPFLTERFYEAVRYAGDLHAAQLRKGTTIPYVSHLLAVAALVIEHGGDEAQAMAALLHDTVEDQPRDGRTAAEVRARFGDRVADLVLELSDTTTHPKPPWRDRKEAYLRRVRTGAADELLISAADKLHNVRTIVSDLRRVGTAVWDRFSASRDDALWYYRSLVSAYREAGYDTFVVDELDRAVTEMERLAAATSS
ncbi:MAG: HD domain-containing protein [Gemmatimonadales bacterium]|jgi:(p)ppGpp synthase/HD superfamily hydrolase